MANNIDTDWKMIDKKSLNRIKEIRIIEDLTLKEVAVASGLTESTIYRIENGLRVPNHITMLQICKGLNMKMEDVFTLDWKNVKFV